VVGEGEGGVGGKRKTLSDISLFLEKGKLISIVGVMSYDPGKRPYCNYYNKFTTRLPGRSYGIVRVFLFHPCLFPL